MYNILNFHYNANIELLVFLSSPFFHLLNMNNRLDDK